MNKFKVGDLVEVVSSPGEASLVGSEMEIVAVSDSPHQPYLAYNEIIDGHCGGVYKDGIHTQDNSHNWWFGEDDLKLVNNKRHKHADLMIAYANDCSLVIEYLQKDKWWVTTGPTWDKRFEYRIKPQEKYYLIIEGYYGDKIIEDIGTEEEMKSRSEILSQPCGNCKVQVVKQSEWENGSK